MNRVEAAAQHYDFRLRALGRENENKKDNMKISL
jgi:hypothetical protein